MNNIILIFIFFVVAVIASYCIYNLSRSIIKEYFQSETELTPMKAGEIFTDVMENKLNMPKACITSMKFCNDTVFKTCINSMDTEECKAIMSFCNSKNQPKSCTPSDEAVKKIALEMTEEERTLFIKAGEVYMKGLTEIALKNSDLTSALKEKSETNKEASTSSEASSEDSSETNIESKPDTVSVSSNDTASTDSSASNTSEDTVSFAGPEKKKKKRKRKAINM